MIMTDCPLMGRSIQPSVLLHDERKSAPNFLNTSVDSTDFLQIHERIVEIRYVTQGTDGPCGAHPHRDFDIQRIFRDHSVSVRPPDPQTLSINAHADALDERLHPRRRLDRPLERSRAG